MIDIAGIEERCEVATPGPWEVVTRGNTVKSNAITASDRYISIASGISPKTANAEFIARSRQDIPDLLAELERVTAERDAAIAHITPKCEICAKENTKMCPAGKCIFQGYEYFDWRGTEGK